MGTRLVFADLRSVGHSIGASPGGSAGSTVDDTLVVTTGDSIGHFTDLCSVTWPLNGSEAQGDLVLIQTSLLLLCKSSCSYAN